MKLVKSSANSLGKSRGQEMLTGHVGSSISFERAGGSEWLQMDADESSFFLGLNRVVGESWMIVFHPRFSSCRSFFRCEPQVMRGGMCALIAESS